MTADPNREATYLAIANLVDFAPNTFHDEVKPRYFKALAAIPGVRLDLLEKYALVSVTNHENATSPMHAEMHRADN